MIEHSDFRHRLLSQKRLIGTFQKTGAHQLTEILGATGLDFVVLDAEHAPLDRGTLDIAILAARAAHLPALVRIPGSAAQAILNALDVGATGILVPHIRHAADALRATQSARYRGGTRGYSNSPRAGNYGRGSMGDLTAAADRTTVVVGQIEDREAVDAIQDIVAIDQLDCIFIGRADLAVSYQVFDLNHPQVTAAVLRVCEACTAAGKSLGIFLPDDKDIDRFEKLGVTLFVIGSDQSLLHAHASSLAKAFKAR